MNKKGLISAAVAREIANKSNSEKPIKIWNKVVTEIEKAAAKGRYSYLYKKGNLPAFIMKQLNELGYIISTTQGDEWNISWERKN